MNVVTVLTGLFFLSSCTCIAFDAGIAASTQAVCSLAPYLTPPFPTLPSEKLLGGATATNNQVLDKHSTAADVVRHLRTHQSLAPFVGRNGVAVVTGGSSGIGRHTVETLAKMDMKVVLCARDTNAARITLNEICQASPYINRSNVRIQPLDLADLNSVESAAKEILANEGKIDVICNNAGVNALEWVGQTAQKFEIHMGVNHIGHFHLTRLLLPYLNSGGRIVTVASSAHASVKKLNVDDLDLTSQRYSPWTGYVQSKLANILFAKGLQEKVREDDREDILSLCLHPGIVKTNLWRHSDHSLVQSIGETMICKSVEQGAATEVFCCIAETNHFRGGDYVVDCQLSAPHIIGMDKTLRRKLWGKTEEMIRKAGFELPENLV